MNFGFEIFVDALSGAVSHEPHFKQYSCGNSLSTSSSAANRKESTLIVLLLSHSAN